MSFNLKIILAEGVIEATNQRYSNSTDWLRLYWANVFLTM